MSDRPLKLHRSADGQHVTLHLDCGAWKMLGTQRMVCELCAGHEGEHDYTRDGGLAILGDTPQA